MKSRSNLWIIAVALASLLCLASCSRKEKEATLELPVGDPLELGGRLKDVKVGDPKLVEEMEQDDVIVAINGYPMTRARFDVLVTRLAKNKMRQKDANEYRVADEIKQQAPLFVSQFVVRRLLLDQARKMKVMTDAELKSKMKEHIEDLQKQTKKTAQQIAQAIGTEKGLFFYEIAERILLDEMIAKHIPPIVAVNDEFVAKVQKQVELENAAAATTNESYKAQMREWKKRIDSGEVSFGEIAEKHSQGYGETNGIKGYWGEFEDLDFANRDFARAVFNLPINGVSDPFEDDNCVRMVQVVGIKPTETNSHGRVIQRELRTLAQIYREKVPELIRQDDEAMTADLKRQMQLQAIDFYANHLKTNGENQVVFPHGEKLFQ